MIDVWKSPPATQTRVSAQVYETNLRAMLDVLKARRVGAVLMTPNPMAWTAELRALYGRPPYKPDDPDGLNIVLATYVEIVRKVARQTGVGLVDVYRIFQDHGCRKGHRVSDLLCDGMHPNNKGHRIIADSLLELVGWCSRSATFVRLPYGRNSGR